MRSSRSASSQSAPSRARREPTIADLGRSRLRDGTTSSRDPRTPARSCSPSTAVAISRNGRGPVPSRLSRHHPRVRRQSSVVRTCTPRPGADDCVRGRRVSTPRRDSGCRLVVKRFALGPLGRLVGDGGAGHPLGGIQVGLGARRRRGCGVSEFATERSHFSTQRCGLWRSGLVGVRSELRGVIRAGFRRRPCRRATPSRAPLFPRGSRARSVLGRVVMPCWLDSA
jgi:hypothetical protein